MRQAKKTFSDGCVASAANDVMADKSAVDHLGDGLKRWERRKWRLEWIEGGKKRSRERT